MSRQVVVSIDTEVDKDTQWRISKPPSFRSVLEGVPEVLTPLFDRYGVVPTYLVSPEVIEDDAAAMVLGELGARAELGTHLHPQLVEPERALTREMMGGRSADDVQAELPREVEAAKLAVLTDLFEGAFGHRPTSFRAGRYGSSPHTLELLADLGYVVDSSVTPGIRWRFPNAVVDHRHADVCPTVVQTGGGSIVELPVSIVPGGPIARALRDAPAKVVSVARRLVGARAAYSWLRPSWGSPDELGALATSWPSPVLVVMFHSMEVVPGASPYARTAADADLVLRRLEAMLKACASAGDQFVGMTTAARSVADSA